MPAVAAVVPVVVAAPGPLGLVQAQGPFMHLQTQGHAPKVRGIGAGMPYPLAPYSRDSGVKGVFKALKRPLKGLSTALKGILRASKTSF